MNDSQSWQAKIADQARILTIGMVAGETSGDTLGVHLMRALKQRNPHIRFEGIGGPQMMAEGLQSFHAMERLSVMGLVEVMGRIRELFAIRDDLINRWKPVSTQASAASRKPAIDLFIGIDAPDFNLNLSEKLQAYGIPTVQYVSPSVWAWRQNRVHRIKRAVNLVLCLFPFEVDFYTRYQVPAVFVGHPLAKQIPRGLHIEVGKHSLGLSVTAKTIGLLPGSRSGEIGRLLPAMLDAATQLLQQDEELVFLIPAINALRAAQIHQYLQSCPDNVRGAIRVFEATDSSGSIGRKVMAASDLLILASGTATLEALLYTRPMVVVYRLHWLTFWLAKRMVKIESVSLPNILAGQKIVPELIQQEVRGDTITAAAKALLPGHKAAYQQQFQLDQIHARLQAGQAADAAEAVLVLAMRQFPENAMNSPAISPAP